MNLSDRLSSTANQNNSIVFSNEKQRAIHIDPSPNRDEASRSLMIMLDVSCDAATSSMVPQH